KPVTVYRLITSNTVEEKIIERAKQKGTIHNIVIAGEDAETVDDEEGDTSIFKPNEMVDILLEEKDADMLRKKKYKYKTKKSANVKRSAKPVQIEPEQSITKEFIQVDEEKI